MTPNTISSYNPGDVVLVPIPFADIDEEKIRPALVISNSTFHASYSFLICIAIHSDPDNTIGKFRLDGLIRTNSGLIYDSVILPERVFTRSKSSVVRKMGTIPLTILRNVIIAFNSFIAQV